MNKRKVSRVLVMLEYGAGDPCNGEVFDLTALSTEIARCPDSKHHSCRIQLSLNTEQGFSDFKVGELKLQTDVDWYCSVDFKSGPTSGYLDDAINASMPESSATLELRKKLTKIEQAAGKLKGDIGVQKLRDAAAVRNKYPIARVTERVVLEQIPEVVP